MTLKELTSVLNKIINTEDHEFNNAKIADIKCNAMDDSITFVVDHPTYSEELRIRREK